MLRTNSFNWEEFVINVVSYFNVWVVNNLTTPVVTTTITIPVSSNLNKTLKPSVQRLTIRLMVFCCFEASRERVSHLRLTSVRPILDS
ncbi:MAG: hypothetical protein ACTS7I_01430 [Candidatus Hodgkinia cicadicola]